MILMDEDIIKDYLTEAYCYNCQSEDCEVCDADEAVEDLYRYMKRAQSKRDNNSL